MPSMPPIKLYKLSSQTSTMTKRRSPATPNANGQPKTLSSGSPPSQYTPQAAAMMWANKRHLAGNGAWSSQKPTTATNAPAPANPVTICTDTSSANSNTSSPTKNVTTTAKPPP